MPFQLRHGDLVETPADALVNAVNERLAPGGGVCGAIFEAAGPAELDAACRAVSPCPTGSAVATPAFGLPARHVIHAVGPRWQDGRHGERELLASAYRSALAVASSLGDRSVAFPLISAGIYGMPRETALEVATGAITGYLADTDDSLEVSLVLFDEPAALRRTLPPGLTAYLEEQGVDVGSSPDLDRSMAPGDTGAFYPQAAPAMPQAAPCAAPRDAAGPRDTAVPPRRRSVKDLLSRRLASLDKGFSETLLDLIDERGLADSAVYHRANMSRQHFSKIRSNPDYRPGKSTVLALAVALELPLAQAETLLARAGYAFSPSSAADVIVRWFIEEGRYDIFEINEALYAYDQRLLGA
ncbi:macro domain-containing protein [Caniella muris]|uniref:macro domain-containing protein n=1 Tax=Caniella muris TaxID=2941502 RepID=UPI0020425B4C|nr:macro domain-containing protein [Caniella muris]